jgi:hypothetical protein
MSPERRNLILMIADGNPKALPYLYEFDKLVFAEKFYTWLILNRITGNTFVEYWEKKFQYSFKAFTEFILKHLKEDRPLLRSDLK